MTILALVGEETGLVAVARRGVKTQAVLVHFNRLGCLGRAAVERFLLLHVGFGKPVQARAGEVTQQRGMDRLAETPHARGEVFDHQDVGIAVDHQAGEAIAFAVHYAPCIAYAIKLQPLLAQCHGAIDACGDPLGIDGFGRVGGEQAQRDAGVPVPEPAPHEATLGVLHIDHAAGRQAGFGFEDLRGPHPGVARGAVGFEANDGEGGSGGVHPPMIAGGRHEPAFCTSAPGARPQRCSVLAPWGCRAQGALLQGRQRRRRASQDSRASKLMPNRDTPGPATASRKPSLPKCQSSASRGAICRVANTLT